MSLADNNIVCWLPVAERASTLPTLFILKLKSLKNLFLSPGGDLHLVHHHRDSRQCPHLVGGPRS
jgi:hypothetical protein